LPRKRYIYLPRSKKTVIQKIVTCP
jgi:hypothetical protein